MSTAADLPAWLTAFWLQTFWWTLAMFAIAALAEMVFPPFPGDSAFFIGLVTVQSAGQSIYAPFLAALIGGLLGFGILFWLGRAKGRSLFRENRKGLLSIDSLHKVETWFARWGNAVIIVGRFLAGVRSAVPIAAGIGNRSTASAMSLGALSILIWNGLLAIAALLLHQNWDAIAGILKTYSTVLWIAGALFIGFWFVKRFRKSQLARSSNVNGG